MENEYTISEKNESHSPAENRKSKNEEPLVSVIVITYNSENYVIETLESAKSQSYNNIELVISDDGSTDHTVEICKEWVEKNKSRFVSVQILTSPSNRGIPANCNKAVKAANGKWIKIIAGDDILLNHCIEENVRFLATKENAKILISNIIHFLDGTEPKKTVKTSKPFWGKENRPQTARQQYEALLLSYCGNTTSFFICKEVLNSIPFDERLSFIEDYPFLLNATKSGIYIDHVDSITVMYRIRNHSVYFGDSKRLFSDFYLKSYEFDKLYRFPYLSKTRRKYEEFNHRRLKFLDRWKLNNVTRTHKIIYTISRYCNIYRYLMFIIDRKSL